MSPPSRNQVITLPNLRPPSPHSSRWSSFARRQRPAPKPTTVTSRLRATKTLSSAPWITLDVPSVADQPVGEDHHQGPGGDPRELVPDEEGDAGELGVD